MIARQLSLDLPHRQALGIHDFYVSDSNREAVAFLDQWPDWPAFALALWGPPGCGKTHLACVWQKKTQAIFLKDWKIAPDAQNLILELKAYLSSPEEEEEFLHFLNRCKEEGKSLLLTHRLAPARWPIRLADLSSRLHALPAQEIKEPDDVLLGALLVKLLGDRQLPPTQESIEYLLKRIDRSFDAARDIVATIDRLQLETKRPFGIALLRDALKRQEKPLP